LVGEEKKEEKNKKENRKGMAQKKKIDEAASVGEGGNGVFLDNLWQVYALGVSL
jgi:hypothetical protein